MSIFRVILVFFCRRASYFVPYYSWLFIWQWCLRHKSFGEVWLIKWIWFFIKVYWIEHRVFIFELYQSRTVPYFCFVDLLENLSPLCQCFSGFLKYYQIILVKNVMTRVHDFKIVEWWKFNVIGIKCNLPGWQHSCVAMADSRAGSSGIFEILFSAVFALISLTTRTILRFGLTTALIASIVITLHAAGQFSKRAVSQRQDGNCLNSSL